MRITLLTLLSTLLLSIGSNTSAYAAQRCVDGMVAGFPCRNVELLAHLTESDIGTTHLSDNWGWTDPVTGTKYAILAAIEGTFFVDLSDVEAPVVLGLLPADAGNTHVRDVKVFSDFAFIVADSTGHDMQIFDLTELRDVVGPPVVFASTRTYPGITHAHNLVMNEATGSPSWFETIPALADSTWWTSMSPSSRSSLAVSLRPSTTEPAFFIRGRIPSTPAKRSASWPRVSTRPSSLET